jgi:hypothetical protein
MDPIDKARLERVEAAIKDRDLNGYTSVYPEDVAGLAGMVGEKSQTDAVKGLAQAAGNNAPRAEGVHFRTEHLAHLVEQVKAHKAPKPKEKDKE